MGIYDRDYARDENNWGMGQGGGSRRSGGPGSWSVVTWIIIINVVIFLFEVLRFGEFRVGMASRAEVFAGHVYLLLTYQFVHHDGFHLLFNMLVLYFWGYQLQRLIGTKSFIGLYIGAGVFGGLAQILFSDAPILGASAAVMGVVFGIITLMPKQVVNLLLFFVIPIRTAMWKIGAFIVVIEVGMFLAQEVFRMSFHDTGIANVAHLGGAFFGWAWIAWVIPWLQNREENQARTQRWTQRFGTKRVVEAEMVEGGKGGAKGPSVYVTPEADAILDKINEHGMQSLTPEERKILEEHSEKIARRLDGRKRARVPARSSPGQFSPLPSSAPFSGRRGSG